MKPPAFTYHRPASVAEAIRTLADVGAEGKVLAGGQSLVPMLNMRLTAPRHLVDINGLTELSYVDSENDAVRVGALTRHAQLARDAEAGRRVPVLTEAMGYVAHPAIRNRGTVVGSLVHADPAAELPAVLLLCDGEVELASATGTRRVGAADFFIGPLESALRSGELAVAARFPVPPPGTGAAFIEVSRRAGDYALCGLGLTVTLDADLRVARATAAYLSVGPTPVRVELTPAVVGQRHDGADWAGAGALAVAAVDPDDDIHATSAYRRHLVEVLTGRAGRLAARRARQRWEES
jgi:carbon-monoxide dehydrogenase medium subunit